MSFIYPTRGLKPLSSGGATSVQLCGHVLKTYVGSVRAAVRAITVQTHQLLESHTCLNIPTDPPPSGSSIK